MGNFFVTSSGLAFVPMGELFPAYHATKADIHALMVGLRQALKGTNINVVEVVPPYVRTELDAENRLDHLEKPMELEEFTVQTFKLLETTPVKDLKELAVGSGALISVAWRQAFNPLLHAMNVLD